MTNSLILSSLPVQTYTFVVVAVIGLLFCPSREAETGLTFESLALCRFSLENSSNGRKLRKNYKQTAIRALYLMKTVFTYCRSVKKKKMHPYEFQHTAQK